MTSPNGVNREEQKVRVLLFCPHCGHEFYQMVDRADLRKIGNHEPVTKCPDPTCGLPV